jgi:hypothetical protein
MAHTRVNSETITVGPVILVYPQLFEPKRFKNRESSPLRYNSKMLIPASQIKVLWEQIQDVAKRGFNGNETQQRNFDWCMQQVGQPDRQTGLPIMPELKDEYGDWWVINPKSTPEYPHEIVMPNPMGDRPKYVTVTPGSPEMAWVRTGAKAYAMINFFSFETGSNLGIAAGLSAVLVWGDSVDISVGSSANVQDGFASVSVTPVTGQAGGFPGAPGNNPGLPPGGNDTPDQQSSVQGMSQQPPGGAPPFDFS